MAGMEMEIVIKVNGGRWDWKRVLRVGFLLSFLVCDADAGIP